MKIMEDLQEVLKNNLEGMAESHVDCWKERYGRKPKKEIKYDLEVNHDPSLEIENVEEALGRKLSDTEYDYVVSQFNKEVLKLL